MDHDTHPRPLWCAHVLDSRELTPTELSVLRMNVPESSLVEDDVEATLKYLETIAMGKDLMKLSAKETEELLSSCGYTTIQSTHFRKLCRFRTMNNKIWMDLVDIVFRPSLVAPDKTHRAPLKKTIADILYWLLLSKSNQFNDYGENLLCWINEDLPDIDQCELFNQFYKALNAFSGDYRKLLCLYWSKLNSDAKKKATCLEVRQEKQKKKVPDTEEINSKPLPIFRFKFFPGNAVENQVSDAIKWLKNLLSLDNPPRRKANPKQSTIRTSVGKQSGFKESFEVSIPIAESSSSAKRRAEAIRRTQGRNVNNTLSNELVESSSEGEEHDERVDNRIVITDEGLVHRGFVYNGCCFDFLDKSDGDLFRDYYSVGGTTENPAIVVTADLPTFQRQCHGDFSSWNKIKKSNPEVSDLKTYCSTLVDHLNRRFSDYNVMGFIFCTREQSEELCSNFEKLKKAHYYPGVVRPMRKSPILVLHL